MLHSLRKIVLGGLVSVSAISLLNILPSTTAQAKNASSALAVEGGITSLLSVIGDSYDVLEVDSELMGKVVSQAEELEIEFDISQYEEEYANFAIAQVDDYINVRNEASTDALVVGHMYNGAVCEIIDKVEVEDGIWFNIVSGSVEGYVKSDYFIYGIEAVDVIDEYVKKVAVVQCNALNIRSSADFNASVIGSVTAGDKLELIVADEDDVEDIEEVVTGTLSETVENGEVVESILTEESEELDESEPEWINVKYTDSLSGYVFAEYVVIEESYVAAKTIEEEAAEREAKIEAERRRQQQAAAAAAAATVAAEDTTIAVPNTSYESTSELRQNIVDYALSFVGTRYVMGGQSLAGGTDCSGFTSYVYAEFGYSLSRVTTGQWANNGRYVSYEELQPGDIVCFGTSSCYHVAMYIGDGQIVHEANSRLGCIVSSINFEPILGYKNVID